MKHHYQRLCCVNPHLFEKDELITQHFQLKLADEHRYAERHKHVGSSIALQLGLIHGIDWNRLQVLHLEKPKHQIMFEWALNRYSNTLEFLLQNGAVYRYNELQKMFHNGVFQKVTGGCTQVSFYEYEYDYGIHSHAA